VNFDPNVRAMSVSLATSPGHASPSARASANNTGRVASESTVSPRTHDVTARVHDEGGRPPSPPRPLRAAEPLLRRSRQTVRGRVQGEDRALDLRPSAPGCVLTCRLLGPSERRACRRRP
jgi:hypothetical protein